MKDLIPILLVFVIFALWGINDSIQEGNLTPREKIQIAEQEKEKQQIIESKVNEIKQLQSKPYSEVDDTQKIEWIFFKGLNSIYFKLIVIFLFITGFYVFIARKY